jgi:hypothetical protein
VLVVLCVAAIGAGGGSSLWTTDSNSQLSASIAPDQSRVDTNQLSDELFKEPSDTVGEPELDVFVANRVVEPGTETTIELTVLNTGSIESGTTLDQETATARGVSITVDDDDAPIEVSDADTAVGSIPPGEAVTVPLTVTAPASADGDSGELDVDVEYTYTEFDDNGEADDETETGSFAVDIEVGSQSRFEIDDVDTDTQVGTDGTVEVELENVGEEDAESVRVSARSPTSGVTVGVDAGDATGLNPPDDATDGPTSEDRSTEGDSRALDESNGVGSASTPSSAAFVGDLDSDDSADVSFDTRIDRDVSVESYLLELTVVYEDSDGILRESATLATAVEPTGAQTFELDEIESTLEVGESGTITAQLENTGPEDVETPVVRVEPASERIDIGENRVAVDSLGSGNTTEISFDADVSGQADPGPRQVTFTVEYGLGDDRLESDPIVRSVTVGSDQPTFTITATGNEIPVGSTETVRLNITNNQRETLSNINVFLYPDGPLSVDSDEAFIPELEPGESRIVEIDVSVDSGAQQRAYPLEVDFRYDTETDDDLISQVYQVPVTATEPPPDDGLLPSFLPFAGLALLVIGTTMIVRWRS